ncbi:hypothetical protein MMC26_006879 [Xylographa opegraphella]|nr:hypothetical protein [Xylographa opegraphella]
MGWMWSDAKKETPTDIAPGPQTAVHDEAIPKAPPSTAALPNPRALTSDEQADAELHEALKIFGDSSAEDPSANSSRANLDRDPPPPSQVNHSSIAPERLYPTTMSCRAAFDSAFYCQSFGGQFMNLYRYGGMRDCSDQWSNFWFCMRTNSGAMGEEWKKRKIQEHYEERARKYKVGPSSEDVWEMRREIVEGAFEGDLEALEEELRKEGKRLL